MIAVELTTAEIQKKIAKFESKKRPRLNMLYEYYAGRHRILSAAKPGGRPNNRIVTNFAKNIVTNTTGYFMGNPITYNYDDETLAERMSEILEYNDDAFVNTQLSEHLSIFGIAAEMLYLDTEKDTGDIKIRYAPINPMQLVVETTGDINDDITLAIRWYDVFDDDDVRTRHIEVYDSETVSYYRLDAYGSVHEEIPDGRQAAVQRHYFGEVPINVYYNNDNRMGDFEDVISLIDAYNTMQSESVNDFQSFADCLMLVKNMRMSEDAIETMREKHVIEAFEDGDVSYLVKQVNDTYVENIKERIKQDIYLSSNTVNMSDESFAGATSGAAIRRRMMNFESRVSQTERYFKKGLQRRFELICNMLGVQGSSFDYLCVTPVFERNIPADIQEIATEVAQLQGMVSKRTLLAQIPFVEDVEEELERLEEEETQYSAGNFGQNDSELLNDDEEDEPAENKRVLAEAHIQA